MNNQIALILRGEISSSTRRDVRACLGIVIAVVLLYLPSLLGVLSGAVPFFYDTLTLFAPWREFARQSLHDGILPLWTPRIFCGMPFMANGQTSVLYPPNVLYWALPMNWALLLDALLHNALLALGTYTLARALGMSRMASCLVVAAWAMGGHVSAHINAGHFTWHAARAYMPWEMWATLCYLRSGARRFIYILAVLFALQLFSGYPPMVVLGAALCIGVFSAFVGSHLLKSRSRGVVGQSRSGLPVGWPFEIVRVGMMVVALSAIVVLPLQEMSKESVHGSGLTFAEAVVDSGSWRSFLRLLLPDFFGGSGIVQWSIEIGAWEETGYGGILVALLAIGAPLFAQRISSAKGQGAQTTLPQAVPWLWALLPVAAVLILGKHTPVYRWLFDHVFVFRLTRFPVRWLELWALCAALLAGFSFDALFQRNLLRHTAAVRENIANHLTVLMWACLLLIPLFLIPAAIVVRQAADGPEWMARVMSTISFERPEHYVAAARELRSRAVMEAFTGCTFALLLAVFAAHWRRLLVHVHDTERKKVGVTHGAATRSSTPLGASAGSASAHGAGEIVVFGRKVHNGGLFIKNVLLGIAVFDVALLFVETSRVASARFMRERIAWPREIVRSYDAQQRWITKVDWTGFSGNIAHGIDVMGGYDASNGKRFFDFVSAMEGKHDWTEMYQPAVYGPMLRIAGVSHLLAMGKPDPFHSGRRVLTQVANNGQWSLWRFQWPGGGPWPRVYLTRNIHRVAAAQQLDLLRKLSEERLSEGNIPVVVNASALPRVVRTKPDDRDRVLGWARSNNMMVTEVASTTPAALVQSETLYPGWRVFVNSSAAELVPANYLFRAVAVPVGKSRVVAVYDNQTFRFAAFVSLCGLLFLVAAATAQGHATLATRITKVQRRNNTGPASILTR